MFLIGTAHACCCCDCLSLTRLVRYLRNLFSGCNLKIALSQRHWSILHFEVRLGAVEAGLCKSSFCEVAKAVILYVQAIQMDIVVVSQQVVD